MTVDELIKKISEETATVSQEVKSDAGLLRLQEVAAQYEGEFKLIRSTKILEDLQRKPVSTLHAVHIPEVDDLIGGFKEQQLITVSAHSKHGKTAMGLFLLKQMESLEPVMIPLEQSAEELVSQRSGNGQFVPNFLTPASLSTRVTVDWIEERVIEGIAKYNTKLVVIDHLGYIKPADKDAREHLAFRIGEIMRDLKGVAKRWNVIIVLLCHISQKDEGNPPTLEDLKNSSDIVQESDMVIMLWRKNRMYKKIRTYENKTLFSVLANRRTGKNGNVGLAFNPDNGLYTSDNAWVADMEKLAALETDDAF